MEPGQLNEYLKESVAGACSLSTVSPPVDAPAALILDLLRKYAPVNFTN